MWTKDTKADRNWKKLFRLNKSVRGQSSLNSKLKENAGRNKGKQTYTCPKCVCVCLFGGRGRGRMGLFIHTWLSKKWKHLEERDTGEVNPTGEDIQLQ